MDDMVMKLLLDIDAYLHESVNAWGAKKVKSIGIGGMAKGFYIGVDPQPRTDFYEVIGELDITQEEVDLWEGVFYRKDSWLNKAAKTEVKA